MKEVEHHHVKMGWSAWKLWAICICIFFFLTKTSCALLLTSFLWTKTVVVVLCVFWETLPRTRRIGIGNTLSRKQNPHTDQLVRFSSSWESNFLQAEKVNTSLNPHEIQHTFSSHYNEAYLRPFFSGLKLRDSQLYTLKLHRSRISTKFLTYF